MKFDLHRIYHTWKIINCWRFPFIKFLFWIPLILVFIHCTPTVDRYKNKARKALQKEDSAKAIEYLQMAFEESLDDDFFPIGKKHKYSGLYFSINRNKLILVENLPSKYKSYFTVYEIARDKDWTRRVKGFIQNASISPNGNYSVFNIENPKNSCKIELWNLQEKEQLAFSSEISCSDHAGVSDSGQIVFAGLNKAVMSYDLKTNRLIEKYIPNLPDPPVKNIPLRSLFQFSSGNSLYFTYGSLGLYYLYAVKDRQLTLISKDGAHRKIFFKPGSDNPGLITGGANAHQVIFFNGYDGYNPQKTFPVRYWKDAAFISDHEYYFVEDNRLVYINRENETKLSFWATSLSADAGGRIYFLSPLGKLMSYNHVDPRQSSKVIFQMGWEIK